MDGQRWLHSADELGICFLIQCQNSGSQKYMSEMRSKIQAILFARLEVQEAMRISKSNEDPEVMRGPNCFSSHPELLNHLNTDP